MDLINKEVTHKSFGKGSVVEQNSSYIEVKFAKGNKRFVYPDVFDTHLTLKDAKLGKLVKSKIKKIEIKRQKEEEEILKEEALQREKQRLSREHEKLMKTHKNHPSLQVVFWCEDDEREEVFTEWTIFTGKIKSGAKKGQPNKLVRLNRNSACLLTARSQDKQEKERTILGLYMVEENFLGKLCEDGYIPAHKEHRLQLTEEESNKMLFWNYYVNERAPERTTWNTGRYRYFENITMAQILKDIVALREKNDEDKSARELFEYFCKLNQIEEKDIPEKNGALVRI